MVELGICEILSTYYDRILCIVFSFHNHVLDVSIGHGSEDIFTSLLPIVSN